MTWFERLHPRDPANGEFIDKGGWARGLADKIGGHFHHKPGRDRRDEVMKDRKSRKKYTQNGFDPHRGDDGLARIAALQGWDAPARTGTSADLDAAIADGGLELWRGVHAPTPAAAARWLEQERTGPIRMGYGIWGNGNYTSVDRRVANQYGTRGTTPPGMGLSELRDYPAEPESLQRMVLSPHARVVKRLSVEWNRGTRDDSFPNINQLAAAGVDVIFIEGRDDGTGIDADQYIILNRTAVLYQSTPPPRDTSQ